MLACLDVHYGSKRGGDEGARAAILLFDAWGSETEASHAVVELNDVAPYVPGQFYRRELPCLQQALNQVSHTPDLILIDGYVWLDNDKPGLGAQLFRALRKEVPIVGVAKTAYRGSEWAEPVFRGRSRVPLYVTAAGCDAQEMARNVQQMHGPHRIPTLLRRVDQLCKTAPQ